MLRAVAADSKHDLLHRVPLFERLGRRELERLGQLTDDVDAPAGRVLMRQGDHGAEMFVISSGRVRIDKNGATIAQLGPGDWFGEMALLSEGNRTATATTEEPSRLFVIAHREFHSLMDEMPSVRTAVFECVADRLRRTESGAVH